MKPATRLRCAACKKRIRDHEPGILLRRLGTEEALYFYTLYFYTRCAAGAVCVSVPEGGGMGHDGKARRGRGQLMRRERRKKLTPAELRVLGLTPDLVIRKVRHENYPMHSKQPHAIITPPRAAKKGDGDD